MTKLSGMEIGFKKRVAFALSAIDLHIPAVVSIVQHHLHSIILDIPGTEYPGLSVQ